MEIVMIFSSILFFLLLVFILTIFAVYVASLFIHRKYPEFTPDASVVIPAYNEEKNIKACLDAVFSSNYPKMEVIVVDDGSTDRTAEIAKGYPVKLLSQNHKGKSEALTLGAKAAKHEFIIALDADTVPEKNCIREIVKPFSDKGIGATTAVFKVKNRNSILGMFQNIEYYYHNIIRTSFSKVFNNGVWFFGALSVYRKSVLKKVGYFKKDTLTEDMDISLEINQAGYRTYSVDKAVASTVAPDTLKGFYKQRSRWWQGGIQSLSKNRQLKKSPSILFLFVNQFWWSFYAFLSLPIIIYQVNYWLPEGGMLAYLFRWFSLSGPFYVLYKIPEWGISTYSIFGVIAGIISSLMIIMGIFMFKDKLHLRNILALFFYFPYTIVLNMVIFISLLQFKVLKTKFYVK